MPFTNDSTPPSGAQNRSSRPKTTKIPASRAARTEAINGLGQLAQVPLIAFKQYADAAVIGKYWGNVSQELATLAESDPVIAKVVDPLLNVGPYAGLVVAVLPMVVQVLVNHGITAPGAMGTVPKNALAAQMEAELAQVELAAMQAQAAAEKTAQETRNSIELARRQMTDAQASQAATVVS